MLFIYMTVALILLDNLYGNIYDIRACCGFIFSLPFYLSVVCK